MKRLRELLFIVCGLLVLQAYAAIAQRHILAVEAAPSSASDASYLLHFMVTGMQERTSFAGKWNMQAGPGAARFTVSLEQAGDKVTGTFSPENGTIEGTVTGKTLSFQWTQAGGYKGSGHLDMGADGRSFTGVFTIIEGPTKGENSVSASRAEDSSFAGKWNLLSGTDHTPFIVSLQQTGSKVTGTFSPQNGTIDGTVTGARLSFQWTQAGGYKGSGYLDMNSDYKSMSGVFTIVEGPTQGENSVSATRAEAPPQERKNTLPSAFLKPSTDIIGARDRRSEVFYSNHIFVSMGLLPVPLDWCREWRVNCGKPAADAYCHQRGFGAANKFEIAENIGRTATFTEHRVCNNPDCDGFKMIECVGTATVFETPWITAQFGYDARLDWCREWGVNCGKPAADAYCQKERGFPLGARRFEIARNAGPTVTITERRICQSPTCDGFKVIECQRSP